LREENPMKNDEFDAIRWMNAFARRRREDDIKQAGLSIHTDRLKVQLKYLGEGHELAKQQREVMNRMVRNAKDGGSLAEFRLLATRLGQLEALGMREMTKQGSKTKR
jgi:hypothetical protein